MCIGCGYQDLFVMRNFDEMVNISNRTCDGARPLLVSMLHNVRSSQLWMAALQMSTDQNCEEIDDLGC